MVTRGTGRKLRDGRESEQGFLLVGVIVMVALVLLVLSVAAPIVAKDLRRERELEAVHRGQQYVRALRLYYKKYNSYPASIEQLEKADNIRYLRQRYVDPITGKDDWRLIGFGQAKTTVKGFFGKPLEGLGGGGGLGSASGLVSSGQSGTTGTSSGQSGISGSSGTPTIGGTSTSVGTNGTSTGSSDSGSSAFGQSSFGQNSSGSNGSGSQSASSFSGTKGPFVGVGIPKEGASIIELNEQTDYSKWEFIYDPRIEQLYAKVSLFGGGPASTSSGSLGSASGLSSTPTGTGIGNGTGTGTTGSGTDSTTSPTGNSPTGSSPGTPSSPTSPMAPQ